jgi:multidrug efflux system outer membrane protein
VTAPRPRLLPVACLAAALAAGGCASVVAPPSALPAVALPADWSSDAGRGAGADAAALATWWQRFGDPRLSALVAEAISANTGLRSAQAALRQARALRDVQAAARWPSLTGSATAQRRTPGGDIPPSNAFGAGVDASWELDLFGRLRSAVAAAEADVQAGAADLADVQVSLAAEVALAYLQLRGAQGRLAIARDNLASQQETLQIAQWRAQAGLGTSLEVEQQRTTTEQTRASLPPLATAAAQAAHALAVLTARPPAALDADLLAIPAPVPRPGDDLALEFPAETLRRRPDVRAAEWRVGAAASRVAQAEAARRPDFRLSGSLGLNALTLAGLGAGSAAAGSLLAAVSVPLFDGGALRAQVRSQQAALDQARIGYEAAVRTALQEVEDALVALRNDRGRLATQRNAADAAGNAALLARQRYASGLVDFQTVLDTQRSLLAVQDAVATSEANVGADHVRLYKALGGGWDDGTTAAATAAPAPALAGAGS